MAIEHDWKTFLLVPALLDVARLRTNTQDTSATKCRDEKISLDVLFRGNPERWGGRTVEAH